MSLKYLKQLRETMLLFILTYSPKCKDQLNLTILGLKMNDEGKEGGANS